MPIYASYHQNCQKRKEKTAISLRGFNVDEGREIQKGKSACPPSKALSLLDTKLQTNSVKYRDEDYLMLF